MSLVCIISCAPDSFLLAVARFEENVKISKQNDVFARSALYVRRVVKIRCPVRASVRPSGFKASFTMRHLRGGHIPLSSEVLKTRFQKNCSKKGQSWTGLCRFVWLGSLFDQLFASFFEKMCVHIHTML